MDHAPHNPAGRFSAGAPRRSAERLRSPPSTSTTCPTGTPGEPAPPTGRTSRASRVPRPARGGADERERQIPRSAHASAERGERARWLALYVLCAGFLMIILDSAIVNVALPAIQSDLGFSQSSLAWVVNAYLIAFGGLLLLAGRLGDLIGRRRMFMAGLTIFTAASLFCGLAQSQEMLIGARFLQGIGGAMTSAVILGMIVTMFPEPGEQAKAIGVYSFIASAGASIGLLAGGVLTEALSWHWIFFVNLPIGVATAVLAMRLVEGDQGIGLGRGADVLGAALVTVALMLGVYTILEVGDYGWTSARTLGFGAVSLALLAGVRRAPGAHAQPAHAAADLPLPQRLGRQRRADADGRRDVRHVLPRNPLPAGRARLRRARDRARVPAGRACSSGRCRSVSRRASSRGTAPGQR